jgi:hypothetical protein
MDHRAEEAGSVSSKSVAEDIHEQESCIHIITVFCYMTTCSSVRYRRFGGTCWIYF